MYRFVRLHVRLHVRLGDFEPPPRDFFDFLLDNDGFIAATVPIDAAVPVDDKPVDAAVPVDDKPVDAAVPIYDKPVDAAVLI